MQKEKKQIILNTIAKIIRKHIPKGKSASTLAAEYGLSTSIISKVLKGEKNISFTTLFMIIEIFKIGLIEFMIEFVEELVKYFTTLDL